ncbi:MAG: CsbD family protein [Planctomyces sp.]|nr:CsbD family protein [Planctomyces sp.]
MNADQLKGNWKIFRGKVKEKWGQLTDDELDVVDGRMDQLSGAIQRRYGLAKEETEKELDRLFAQCDTECR